jgi:hypothetical protein
VPARRGDNIAPARPNIDAGAEQRFVGGPARSDLDALGAAKNNVLAAAAGHHAPSHREVVVTFQRSERSVTIMTRVDVEHDQLVAANAEIGRRLVGEPLPDHGLVGRCGEQPVWRQSAVRMLRAGGGGAVGRLLAATDKAAVDPDRPV